MNASSGFATTAYTVSGADLEFFRTRMRELGINQSDLARRAGVGKGAISRILAGRTVTSRAVPAIRKVLGAPEPQTKTTGDDLRVALILLGQATLIVQRALEVEP